MNIPLFVLIRPNRLQIESLAEDFPSNKYRVQQVANICMLYCAHNLIMT